ncbi:hypothetical protein [Amycolatopsis sp. Poz14]|uniref:hypothetical protein n=1 Tax=Amycolatopsis sp. Poz14 TaxID=1447705 RepID=UPI001EE79839|nr:hypothetical protein [Amycolatopsis sp. Poz14]MCG3749058.1 hypothetical protein [Amycolatopsis sp. Poz14]
MADRASNRTERNSSFARAGARRRPRAWAAPIARPAARIAVAGGLTLAGWLLGAALSQANAAADEHIDRPAASAPDTEPEHRYAGTATSGTLTWAMPGAQRASLHRFHISADDYRPDVSFRPAAVSGNGPGHHASIAVTRPSTKITKPAKAKSPGAAKHHAPASDSASDATTLPVSSPSSTNPEPQQGLPSSTNPEPQQGLLGSTSNEPSQGSPSSQPEPGLLGSISSQPEPQQGLLGGLLGGTSHDSGPGLLGGLLGGTETGHPGLLDGILGTVNDTVDTTLHTTVTSVDTVIDTAPVRVVEPPVAPVEPAPSASGAVSVSVPAGKLAKEPEAPVVVQVSKQAPVVQAAPARVLAAQPAAKQETQPAPPVKERSQAGGGSSGGGEGLPSAPAAPAAPASTVSPGHDGHGGLRQLFALAGDGDTVTQLKLIGVSRDHEVDGAGRDAALPTTSPD